MNISTTKLPGVLLIEPKVFQDDRGFFLESYNKERYQEAGIKYEFVQDNHSKSAQNVLRGLHFQINTPQGKLVRVTEGVIYDVIADINPHSDSYGEYIGIELDAQKHNQIYIPPGYAHGFCVLTPTAQFNYKCTDYYNPADEGGVMWNDPLLDINWPINVPILSAKDKLYQPLKNLQSK